MDRVVDQAKTGGHNGSARLTSRKLPRLGLFKTALAVLAGGFGAGLAGTLGPPAVEAATTQASSFAAYGTDTTYEGDPETGFDASDVGAGFTTGVSGNGKLAGVVGTVGTLLADDRADSPASLPSHFAAGVLALGANGKLPGGIPYKEGTGVFAYAAHGAVGVDAYGSGGIGVHGTTNSDSASAIVGQNNGGGPGLHGISASGIGGVFEGAHAAVRLMPSTAPSHPRAGQVGELTLDASHRLWFCKRGGNPAVWKQLA